MSIQPQEGTLKVRPIKTTLPEKIQPQIDPQVEDNKLTPRQRIFVELYISGMNAKQAALNAGYSESVANSACSGTNLLYNPSVQAEIQKRTKAKFQAMNFNAERMLELAIIRSQVNILDYCVKNEKGKYVPDLDRLDRDAGYCIKEISYDLQGNPKIAVHDPSPWWTALAKHYGICKDTKEVTGPNGGPIQMTVEFLDKALRTVTNNVQINVESGNGGSEHLPEQIIDQLQLSE